jgi:predicted NBD/HSP70 family sugar kinase
VKDPLNFSDHSKGSHPRASIHNRRLVLKLLHESPMTRSQLSQITGLRTSTITYIVRDLIQNKIVRTVGKVASQSVGRKQILVEVNPQLGWSVGIGLGGDMVSLAYVDASRNMIDRDQFEATGDIKDTIAELKDRTSAWAKRKGDQIGRLLSVGMGIPGMVDPEAGVVMWSTEFGVKDLQLAKLIKKHFGVNAYIDNDVNFAAHAEAQLGSAQEHLDFVYFLMNVKTEGDRYRIGSLGSSLYLNGRLRRGSHFVAGEIDLLLQDDERQMVTAEELLLMDKPDAPMTEGMRHLAVRLGTTMAAVADLIDPKAVILGGSARISNNRIVEAIQAEMNQRLLQVPGREIHVLPSTFQDRGVSVGAAIAAIDTAMLSIDESVLSRLGNQSGASSEGVGQDMRFQ